MRYNIPYKITHCMSFKAKPELTTNEKTHNKKEKLLNV